MADLSKQQCFMKRLFILLLALMPVISFAQELSKKEKKAEKARIRAERAEARRIADSIELAKWETRDARLAAANAKWAPSEEELAAKAREEAKKGATVLLCRTIFDDPQEAFDLLVHNLLRYGVTPAEISERYFIFKTPQKMVGSATYDITFTAYLSQGKAYIRASGTAYKSFSVGGPLLGTMMRSDTNMIVPVEYGGAKGSLFYEAWNEMETFIKHIPHEELIYTK